MPVLPPSRAFMTGYSVNFTFYTSAHALCAVYISSYIVVQVTNYCKPDLILERRKSQTIDIGAVSTLGVRSQQGQEISLFFNVSRHDISSTFTVFH
jgi:hypothetical protein